MYIGKSDELKNTGIYKDFIKPDHKDYSFAKIPQTIEYILTGDYEESILPKTVFGKFPHHYDKVVLFFLDGFGWKAFNKYANNYKFLKKIKKQTATKISTQFPSTTASQITTIHTGMSVEEHGVYEWYYYEPIVDKIISPLKFSYVGNLQKESLAGIINPKKIFNLPTIYQKFKKRGISSFVFQPEEYTKTSYSSIFLSGAKTISYKDLSYGLKRLQEKLQTDKGKSYYHFYYSEIDRAGHLYGSNSEEFNFAVKNFFNILEKIFFKNLDAEFTNTLCIITSDHGQIDVDPENTKYINVILPEITKFIKTDGQGRLLAPAGGCRDMFFYIKNEYLKEAKNYIKNNLGEYVEVYTIDELINWNIFNKSKITKRFLDRVGNLVILPKSNGNVWWYEKNKFEQKLFGHHGGLTGDESETIFLLHPLYKS